MQPNKGISAKWLIDREPLTFSDKLRFLRRDITLETQKEAAERIGISHYALLKIENGRFPSVLFAIKLAKGYGVSLDWLFATEMEEV